MFISYTTPEEHFPYFPDIETISFATRPLFNTFRINKSLAFSNGQILVLFYSNIIHDKHNLQHILVNKQLIMIDVFLFLCHCSSNTIKCHVLTPYLFLSSSKVDHTVHVLILQKKDLVKKCAPHFYIVC